MHASPVLLALLIRYLQAVFQTLCKLSSTRHPLLPGRGVLITVLDETSDITIANQTTDPSPHLGKGLSGHGYSTTREIVSGGPARIVSSVP